METRQEHFNRRLQERGTIVEVWLPGKVYETYPKENINPKIIQVIEEELQRRAQKIFKEGGGRNTVVLVLKAMGVTTDGKEYNILLKASNGNIGHTYYIPVTKGAARTIILTKYKTTEEIYEAAKQHLNRDYPETREESIELVGENDYIFKIDLDKLVGKQKEYTKEFEVSKEDLPYKVRTDYRVGANFDHKTYGVGKIVGTSSGVKGIGDSRGKLDWVDVDFGKMYVKGGKPTTVRRIDKVYTTVHFGDQLVKEEKEDCGCGCNTCHLTEAVLLKENKHRQILSESLTYHIDNKIPLTENVFRYGSNRFLSLWKEARYLYSRNMIDVSEADKSILTETYLGEYGLFEGQKVPLDLPQLEEAEYQGKDVQLNKPKRGGSKKFYVYVKDPKTKKIKKVSFGGTTGLKAKINDPEARQSFAKRHNCADKKDKTQPGYWSCRLPRFAKLLGLKGSYTGFW
jgi:hypothetical protein